MPGFDYGKYMASREGRSAMKDLGSGMGLTSEGDMPSEGTAALKAAGSVASMANPIPRAISAGAEGLRQIGKYGKDIDPRLAGLENLGGKSALSSKDIEEKLSGVPSQVAKGMKSIPGLGMISQDLANKKHVESYNKYRDASAKGTDLDERKFAAKVFGESLEKADPKTQQHLMNQVGAKDVKDLYDKVIHPSGSSDPKLAGVWGAVVPSNMMREANQTGMSKEAKDAAKRWSKNANIMPVTGAKSPSDVSQPGFGKSLTEEEMVKNPMMKRLLGF